MDATPTILPHLTEGQRRALREQRLSNSIHAPRRRPIATPAPTSPLSPTTSFPNIEPISVSPISSPSSPIIIKDPTPPLSPESVPTRMNLPPTASFPLPSHLEYPVPTPQLSNPVPTPTTPPLESPAPAPRSPTPPPQPPNRCLLVTETSCVYQGINNRDIQGGIRKTHEVVVQSRLVLSWELVYLPLAHLFGASMLVPHHRDDISHEHCLGKHV
ncbi:uncharacterized protein MELLADRAFT_101662 [Melampsora larici-populina 98AG31]|uniref:Uncharacterized protein n=1 Tax=Melampsora larici-populina (strain 98AG31 / pathotype 3-4-7) TaxID=747676 RepID=F4R6K2_MELLP|nr:uncharacterized protein MELLADRAFT_101662 [Melampsora larici-populina 98AG31]EGG12451.1 hypothetical protein MELLADRAFT_101662 [Melampsora larici-populina 98AG31]